MPLGPIVRLQAEHLNQLEALLHSNGLPVEDCVEQGDIFCGIFDAEKLIAAFLDKSKASLGSSKSLVDQNAEGQAVMSIMSHLNQVGQTGSTPRHPKGLATCCHGEEPHVVGWRFIGERRVINTDANCSWVR